MGLRLPRADPASALGGVIFLLPSCLSRLLNPTLDSNMGWPDAGVENPGFVCQLHPHPGGNGPFDF